MRRVVVVMVGLLVGACASAEVQPRSSAPDDVCGNEVCNSNQVCYLDGRRATALDNPSCQLAPAACAENLTCECLVRQVRVTVCDETQPILHATVYP
jgi:hypothetical protein